MEMATNLNKISSSSFVGPPEDSDAKEQRRSRRRRHSQSSRIHDDEASGGDSRSEKSSDDQDDNGESSSIEDEEYNDGADFWKDDSDEADEVEGKEAPEQVEEAPLPQRLLRLTQRFQFDAVNELLKQPTTTSAPLERDQHKRTAAHYAAMHSKGQATLQLLVALLGGDCLSDPDNDKVTPFHFAAGFHSRKNFSLLLKHSKRKSLELRDNNGACCAHWAGRNKRYRDVALTAIEAIGPKCLSWVNTKRRSVLCDALMTCRTETAKKLLALADPECLKLKDEDGNTWVHCLATNRIDESVIFLAVKMAGPECLGWQNVRKLSVLQRALEGCGTDTARKLVAISGPETLQLRDETGSTCLHAVENNKEEIILAALNSVGIQCLAWQNGRKQSVLHDAVLNCSTEFANKIVQMASTECLSIRDEDGNSCLHDAVRSDTKVDVVLTAVKTTGWWCLSWQNNKKQSVLYLAVSACNAAAASHLLKMAPAEVLRVDGDGNTLLHSLFQSEKHRHTDNEIQEFFSMMTSLVGAGVNLLTENNIGQNCLHGTTMQEKCLALIMLKSTSSDISKGIFKQLLKNSNGHHAVHAFASRYRLREIVRPLANLSDMQVSDLLRLTVSMDTNKGATCLHFACEAGNKENIGYLMNQGLLLQTVTHTGLSCIDYAYDKGKLDEVLVVAEECQKGMSKTDLWRLVDPAPRALKLPDRSNSRQLLASIAHESKMVDTQSGSYGHISEDRTSRRRGSTASVHDKQEISIGVSRKDSYRTDWDILLRALELDSTRILRSALSLNLITTDTERFLPAHLTLKLQSEQYDSNRYFLNPEMFLDQKLINTLSEMSIIDIAAFFDKVEVLPDLILTRQFELIPACVSLLVHLKPKIVLRQGRHEQLKQLQDKITCIVVNALDALYVSASDDEKMLLVDYIRGDLRDDNGENPGPLFPCRRAENSDNRSPEYLTLMDMVEEANCSALIETDCLHRVAQRAWHPRSQNFDNNSIKVPRLTDPFTPRVKYYIHHFAFILFLAYSAWYTIDFRATFRTLIPDIILTAYAASLTAQEAMDFWRRRVLKNFYLGKRLVRCPRYFEDGINIFDCIALTFLWVGLIWKWAIYHTGASDYTTYTCQMILSTSFMLWGFRSVAFLSYHERTGPVISMLSKLLILDLLPFLAIIIVIFYVFGVFFFNLLFPVSTALSSEIDAPDYGWSVVLQVFTLPFNLLFTNFDKIIFSVATPPVNQSVGKVAHPVGLEWFSNFLVFLFLMLVNLVMVNLLIALFSLRVSRMDSRALGIWRRTYFEMLREYQSIGPMPPPLSFISEIVIAILRSVRDQRVNPAECHEWWLNERDYPNAYVRFLKFQASRFRRVRPHLTREVTRNRSDFDGLKAHTGNLLERLEGRLDGRLETLTDRQEETAQKFVDRFDTMERSLGERLQRLEATRAGQEASKNKQQATVVDIGEMVKSPETGLQADVRVIKESIVEVEAQYQTTELRLKRQRNKMKELNAKLDTLIDLVRQHQSL